MPWPRRRETTIYFHFHNANIHLINERFKTYFYETFFQDNPEMFQKFLISLEKPLPRTIRFSPWKQEGVKKRLTSYGYILWETNIPNVHTIELSEKMNPLEKRIGFTLDHIIWNFYIQELAAATSVHILSNGGIDTEKYLILDMASSPWWKTTQLAEQYPNSFIIANEPTRDRIPQLLQNLGRMGTPNVGVTLYPGQYFRNTPEVFDRILLDAPCSGEWTLYKWTKAVSHWHIKNIKKMAALQEKLLDAALIALKVGWEMVYSTCSMNLLENEWVLEKMKKKYGNAFEIISQKHFWPHVDQTGGFFVAKIHKNLSIETIEKNDEKINTDIKTYKGSLPYKTQIWINLYEHLGKILVVKDHPYLEFIRKKYYFMRFGEAIGYSENGNIRLDSLSYRYLDTSSIKRIELNNETKLDQYLHGEIMEYNWEDGEILITYDGEIISKETIKNNTLSNSFPYELRRK